MKSPWQMIKQAYLSAVTDDSSAYPKGQAGYNDKTTDFLRYSLYGLDSNPPLNSWVLLLGSQGQEAVKIGLISDFLNRKKGLKEGEVVLYNTLTQSFVLLKENGDIEVDAKNDLIATVAGDATITATNVTVNGSTKVSVLAPSVQLGVPGFLSLITSAFIAFFNLHTHSGVVAGAAVSGPPILPMTPAAHATTNTEAS